MFKSPRQLFLVFTLFAITALTTLACGISNNETWQEQPVIKTIENQPNYAATLDSLLPTDENAVIQTPETGPMEDKNKWIDTLTNDPNLSYSMADSLLKKDVLTSLVEQTYQPGCQYSINGSSVINAPVGNQSPWEEEWLMTICSQDMVLQINFTPDSNGGTNFEVISK